jgi:hypothetical protein
MDYLVLLAPTATTLLTVFGAAWRLSGVLTTLQVKIENLGTQIEALKDTALKVDALTERVVKLEAKASKRR